MATNSGRLAQDLSNGNPWWRDPNWHAKDKDLKAALNSGIEYEPDVLNGLTDGCLYILRGPRRTGKTVAVKQTIKRLLDAGVEPHRIIRVSTDGWTAKDLKNLVLYTAKPPIPEGKTRYWFIDEVSAITGEWNHEIKNLRDENEQFSSDTVVLTGSNSARLKEAVGVLADRRGVSTDVERTLFPMGFASFVEILAKSPKPPRPMITPAQLRSTAAEQAYHALLPWLSEFVELWDLYLLYGGFPTSVACAKAGRAIEPSFVKALFDVIQKDAFKSSRLSDAQSMSLQERLWSSMANPINLTSIASSVGIVQETVRGHLQYLRDAFLIWDCPKLLRAGDWLPQSAAQGKIYAVDPLVARLPHLRNYNREDIDPSILSEMQLGMALRRRLVADHPDASWDDFIFYFRSTTDSEIDFVSQYLDGTALEGKYVHGSRWTREAATLEASIWDGIMVTQNVLDTYPKGTWAVPAAFLCYLMDT